jgi:hypothetical protein
LGPPSRGPFFSCISLENDMADSKDNPQKAAASAAPEKLRKAPELHADRLQLAEHKRNLWHVDVPYGTDPQDLTTASYWAHLSHRLRQHDVIECLWEDSSAYVECRVLGSGHGWVKVAIIRAVKFEAFSPEQYNTILPGHRVQYVNNFAKWCVVRDADKRTLKDKCDTEGEAYTWLANYAKSIAA